MATKKAKTSKEVMGIGWGGQPVVLVNEDGSVNIDADPRSADWPKRTDDRLRVDEDGNIVGVGATGPGKLL